MVKEKFRNPIFISVIICICFFYSGKFTYICKLPASLLSPSSVSEVYGEILSSPAKSSSGKTYSCIFKLYGMANDNGITSTASGRINVYIPSKIVEVYFPGKLYSSTGKEGYLYEAGGVYYFKGKFTENGFYVSECNGNYWRENAFGKIDLFRARCRLQFKRLMYAWGKAGGLLLALLSGAREYTEEITKEAFKNAGLSHVLALSGMHLSLFSSVAVMFGKKIKVKKLIFALRIIVLISFVWFAGFSPSLLRAFICSVLTLLALYAGTDEPDLFNILCFSFLLQTIISPYDLQNIGFVFSYGALAGILLTGSYIRYVTDKIFIKNVSSSLSASIGAQTFTAPISLKVFGSFAPIGIIASTVISPLITVFIYSGLFLIVVSLVFPMLCGPSGFFMYFQYTVIKKIVTIFSYVPRITI